MKQCILHVGMHKTGTTSIQDSLYYGLTDPAFRYISLGERNGGRGMATLFGDSPENYYMHRRLGWSVEQVMAYRRRLLSDFEKKLAATQEEAQIIVSAERCWRMSQIEFERVHTFMADRDYAIRIIAYIRPWKEWLESSFQQRVKMGQHTFALGPADYNVVSDYYQRIQTLETVFGAAQVQVFKYDPRSFPEGCVVRDFCQHLGIHFEPNRIRRVNESLKLPAVQLLYAYYKFGPGYGTGEQALTDNNLMIQQLRQLGGPSLRFHSTLIEPLLPALATQRPWIEQRLGVPFTEDIYRDDHALCIREEADLFNFLPAALLWLAAATGNAPIRPTSSHQAAQAVSEQMQQLRRQVARKARLARLLDLGKRQLFRLKQLVRNLDPATI